MGLIAPLGFNLLVTDYTIKNLESIWCSNLDKWQLLQTVFARTLQLALIAFVQLISQRCNKTWLYNQRDSCKH
jgi:hypothetical protein